MGNCNLGSVRITPNYFCPFVLKTDGFDSFVSIGCPGRPFATEDPKVDDLLPASCAAWDRGVRPSDPFVVCADSA